MSGTTFSANVNVQAGYTETVCLSCTNAANGFDYDTITLDNYIITQTANPCLTSLSVLVLAPPTFAYASSGTVPIADWTNIIANSETSPTCDPTSCELRSSDCSQLYSTVYPMGRLTIASSSPWAITSVRNVVAGWVETVCLQCTNTYDT